MLRPTTTFLLAGLFIYALLYSTVLHQSYSDSMVKLYGSPLWRITLIIGLIMTFSFDHTIGLFLALMIFLYYGDVGFFTAADLGKKSPVA